MRIRLAVESGATVETAVPIIVAVLTVAGAVLAPRLGGSADELRRAERLTTVLEQMPPSPQRDLVERVRDDHAVTWTLGELAPAFTGLRNTGRMAYAFGIALLAGGAVYLLLSPGMQWWYWISYLLGAVLVVLGGALLHVRTMRRRDWVGAERARRGLDPAASPSETSDRPRAGRAADSAEAQPR